MSRALQTPRLPASRGLARAACIVAALSTWSGCADVVVTPIRRAAASSLEDGGAAAARDGGSRRDGGDDRDDDRGPELDEEHCAEVLDWPDELASAEAQLLAQINELRAQRIACGDRDFEDLEPLRLSDALQCSARLHSRDMALRGFEGRTNPDGDDPEDRMRAAGFRFEEGSESIVSEQADPAGVLERLLDDRDDCTNVATRGLDEIGIGRYEELWTLDFGRD
jgi:uncharacterized protein YkwD